MSEIKIQEYPKALYRGGKAPASGVAVDPADMVIVKSPAEEEEAGESGFKAASSRSSGSSKKKPAGKSSKGSKKK